MIDTGDYIEIKTNSEKIKGILLPSTKNKLILKLDNGYNIGIDIKKIKSKKLIKKKIQQKEKYSKINENNKLPLISVLHTGGTIASRVNYKTGGVYASFSKKDLLTMFPELGKIANIQSIFVSNIMSEDIRFEDYKTLSNIIKKEIKNKVKGIIIGHGTDTLAITAAALSFIFENPPIPIILVGSQRSSDRGSSDSTMNLICASEFIAKTDFKGVAICMHESISDNNCLIMPATKTRKLHTSRRDAFKVVNDKPIAKINYKTRKIQFIKKPENKQGKLTIKDKFENKVAILKTYPNMYPDFFNTLITKKYKGLVLEASGIGQAPTNTKENLPNYNALKKFIKTGGIVVLTSQCVFGRVHKDIYTNCRRLADIGVIFGEDMLTETAFIKLAWLLSNYKKEEAKKLITENLRGEINTRIKDEFL